MAATEPAHVFRVGHPCGAVEYVAADYMSIDGNGCARLFLNGEVLGTLIAYIAPGIAVTRLDTLLTPEGLNAA